MPAIKKLGYHPSHVIILRSNESDKNRSDALNSRHKSSDVKVLKYYAVKFSDLSSVKI